MTSGSAAVNADVRLGAETCAKNTVPATATPTAPPSCWAVPNTPDASPASSRPTAESTTLTSGITRNPSPAPAASSPGTVAHVLTGALECSATSQTAAEPAAISTPPKHRTPRPYFGASETAGATVTNEPAQNASSVSPACVGE